MKDRIKQLMEAQHMNQQTFATFTGINTASLSSIFTGRTRPTLNHVDAILEKFPNVNPMWLLKGTGGMLLSADDTAAANGKAADGASATALSGTVQGGNNGAVSSANMSAATNSYGGRAATDAARQGNVAGGIKTSPSFQFNTEQKSIVQQRKITEIRVFYDDQTWEAFVPKKEK